MTATQRMARLFYQNDLDWTTALFNADTACSPACSILGPYAYWNSQFSQLRAQSSMADADYNSLQLTLRKRWSDGYQFDVNYTLSKSTDLGSAVERDSRLASAGIPGSCSTPGSPSCSIRIRTSTSGTR